MKSKLFPFLAFFAIVLGGAFFFRYHLIASGTSFFLKHTFGRALTHQQTVATDQGVMIRNLEIDEKDFRLIVPQATANVDIFGLMKGKSPHFSSGNDLLGWIVALKERGVTLEIELGELVLGDRSYAFSLNETGTLNIALALDPKLLDTPFLTLEVNREGGVWTSQLNIANVASEEVLPLAALAFPESAKGLCAAEGTIRGNVKLLYGKGVSQLSTQFELDHFSVADPKREFSFAAVNVKGDLSYPEGASGVGVPIWRQLLGSLSIETGGLSLGRSLTLTELDGDINFDPREDPTLGLTGMLVTRTTPLALKLIGKGKSNEADYVEFGLNLNDRKGTECTAFLSLCAPNEDMLIIQLEADQLQVDQVEMVKQFLSRPFPRLGEGTLSAGTLGGRVVALIDRGEFSHFEFQDVIGKDMVWHKNGNALPLSLDTVKITGRIDGWEKTPNGEVEIEATLPLCHLLGCASPYLRTSYEEFREEDPSRMTVRMDFDGGQVRTTGGIECLAIHESLQFGFVSDRAFPEEYEEMRDGWVRAERLTPAFYGPFVRSFLEDVELFGEIDLMATLQESTLDLSLQIERFLVKHPLFDLQAESIGTSGSAANRMRLSLDLKNGDVTGDLPLRRARGYERQLGLLFDDLDANLALAFSAGGQQMEGSIQRADLSLDGTGFCKNAQFDFLLDGSQFVVSKGRGELPIPSDRTYAFVLDELAFKGKERTIAGGVFENENQLATVSLKREEVWKGQGEVLIDPIKGKADLFCDWRPLESILIVNAKGEPFELTVAFKEGGVSIEHFSYNEWAAAATLTFGDEGIVLNNCLAMHPNVKCVPRGTLFLDFPQADRAFSIRSELTLEGELISPFPMDIHTVHPAKISYCPTVGWMVSDLELASNQSALSVDHFEAHNGGKNLSGRSCRFSIAKDVLDALIDAKLVPTLVKDFRLSRHLKGKAAFNHSPEQSHIQVRLDNAATWKTEGSRDLFCRGDFKDGGFEVSLSEEDGKEGLLFSGKSVDGNLAFSAIHGTLGRLKSSLKKVKGNSLKGTVGVDFSLFSELFTLPANRYLSKWKAGKGFHFEGTFVPNAELALWGFRGKVKGDAFECCGRTLRSLEAKVDMTPGQVTIEDLDLTDDAGKLWIEEGALMKTASGDWTFSFPMVEVRSFKPSILNNKGPSPLMIKSATLHNIRGFLEDASSILGTGTLRFQNRYSAGERILPKGLSTHRVEQLGLDGALFVPISGEVNFTLREGRCYLSELHNVVSTHNHSEFVMPRSGGGGFIDFDGKLYLDLQVRQSVAPSIRGPLSLIIRGTWDEPEMSVR